MLLCNFEWMRLICPFMLVYFSQKNVVNARCTSSYLNFYFIYKVKSFRVNFSLKSGQNLSSWRPPRVFTAAPPLDTFYQSPEIFSSPCVPLLENKCTPRLTGSRTYLFACIIQLPFIIQKQSERIQVLLSGFKNHKLWWCDIHKDRFPSGFRRWYWSSLSLESTGPWHL